MRERDVRVVTSLGSSAPQRASEETDMLGLVRRDLRKAAPCPGGETGFDKGGLVVFGEGAGVEGVLEVFEGLLFEGRRGS